MSTLRDQLHEALQATVHDTERCTQATRVIDAVCAALEASEAGEETVSAAAGAALGDAVTRAEEAVAAAEAQLQKAAS